MVDESTRNFVEKTKEELENSLNSINKTISDLQTNLDGVFRDGILTEAEKNSIKQALQILQNEKSALRNPVLPIQTNFPQRISYSGLFHVRHGYIRPFPLQ